MSPAATPVSRSTSLLGGASLLIALQTSSRLLTFLINQLLLRYLSPSLLAISTQLEVYSISILFFSRESLRVAIQRQTDSIHCPNDSTQTPPPTIPSGHISASSPAGKTQSIINLSYISLFLGLLFTSLMEYSYLLAAPLSVLHTPYFRESLRVYSIAALVELLAEPCFVVVQQKSAFSIRAKAESVATVGRCVVTCGVAVWAARKGRDVGVLPFAAGQGVYALGLVGVYYWGVWGMAVEGGFSLMVRRIFSDKSDFLFSYFSKPLLHLGMSLFTQSIIKHFLTQGDTILISTMATPTAQGIYALASNYGGLVARLILQPIEEMSRNYFGKLLSASDGSPSKQTTETASSDLNRLLRSYLLLSVAVVAVGPTIAPQLLGFVAGERWRESGAGHVLAVYCYYIPLLALNGICEAFVSSVATKSEVYKQSVWMTGFSVGFACASYLFLGVMDLGAEGLVYANMANMLLRIVWSGHFIVAYCARHGVKSELSNLLPKGLTISLGVVTYATLAQIETTLKGGILDLIKTGMTALAFVILLAASERKYILECYHTIKG